jgi:hypothetical protein
MWSASSVLRWYLAAGAAGSGIIAACAYAPGGDPDGANDGGCLTASCDAGIVGEDAPSSEDAGGPVNVTGTTDAGKGASTDSGKTPPPVDGGSGDWVNMTNNPDGCENLPGTPCGWTANKNTLGYTCTCYDGNDAVPWGCEAPGSCVTPGPKCPASSAPICVADAGSSDAGPQGGGGDAGGWIDMEDASACENHPGAPCGWSSTPNVAAGYTCICYFPGDAVEFGCEPAGTVALCTGG